jgi:uncharacterized protein YuzE
MKLTIDAVADAAYLQLSDNDIVQTESLGGVNIDLDRAGEVVGIEILSLQPSVIKDRRESQEERERRVRAQDAFWKTREPSMEAERQRRATSPVQP